MRSPGPDAMRAADTLQASLREVVGDANVLTDPDAMAGFLVDWTGAYRGEADAVVRPRTTDEVSAVVRICSGAGARICVQGGNTGLVGGSVPPARRDPERPTILLSTSRMTDIDEVDVIGRCVGAQAGATVAAIDARAAQAGLAFPIDLASRESATAGGVVSTNAGGTRMIRRGNTRSQVLGIEAVLADGRVLRRWTSLIKDNVGYDLPGLLAGSEGTLAVVTRVLFRLVVPPASAVVAVAAVDHVQTAIDLIGAASSQGLTVEAAELMTEAGIALVHEHGQRHPTASRAPFYVLLEVSGPGDIEAATAELLSGTDGLADAVLEPAPARALWGARESHTESIARSSATPVVKLDISVPIRALPEAFAELAGVGGLRRLRLPSGSLRTCRRRQHPRQSPRRPRRTRRRRHRHGVRDRLGARRFHQRRARHRTGEGAMDPSRSVRRRPGRDAGDQVGARPAVAAEPGGHLRVGVVGCGRADTCTADPAES